MRTAPTFRTLLGLLAALTLAATACQPDAVDTTEVLASEAIATAPAERDAGDRTASGHPDRYYLDQLPPVRSPQTPSGQFDCRTAATPAPC